MKKYGRWVVFGLVAVGIIALLLLIGTNKKLRQRLTALLLERKVKNEIQDLKDKAANVRAKAETSEDGGKEAEAEAQEIETKIAEKKKNLEQGLKDRGLSADEISDRFNNLDI